MKDFDKTWEELNTLNEDAQLQLIFDKDINAVRALCKELENNKTISYTPNEKIIKMLIQMANIIQQENGRIPYGKFVQLATDKISDIVDSVFSVAITRHIPGKGQGMGDIRPFEDALIDWRAFGKSREDEDILAEALGLERADYVETKDYFSAGYGNYEPDLKDPNNGYTFDVKCFNSIDKVNEQKNRTALFILLTNPVSGAVSLYIRMPKEGGVISADLPTTDYKLVDKNYKFAIPELNDAIKKYLNILENVQVPSRENSSYEKPSKLLDDEELFTEDNFKILDALLAQLGFEWPLRKK